MKTRSNMHKGARKETTRGSFQRRWHWMRVLKDKEEVARTWQRMEDMPQAEENTFSKSQKWWTGAFGKEEAIRCDWIIKFRLRSHSRWGWWSRQGPVMEITKGTYTFSQKAFPPPRTSGTVFPVSQLLPFPHSKYTINHFIQRVSLSRHLTLP